MLYNTYRPLQFKDIIGQNAVNVLLKQSTKGRFGHAYLFFGQSGSGKTTAARVLAMALNCQDKTNGEPCGKCPDCKTIIKSAHADVWEFDGAKQRGIEDIKSLCTKAHFAPWGGPGRHKIYIIDEAHQITIEGMNALLKLLEEPPDHLIIILCTTRRDLILDTIASRCQLFPFTALAPDAILAKLSSIATAEGENVPANILQDIANNVSGNLRQAETMLEQVLCAV